jgi:hypothetical protein
LSPYPAIDAQIGQMKGDEVPPRLRAQAHAALEMDAKNGDTAFPGSFTAGNRCWKSAVGLRQVQFAKLLHRR